ncbi:MAG: adenylyltransferase/cytidyltransferase family protein [Candidatus Woesearchaeota archaeon]
MKRVMVSGGFDPIHIGHVRLINSAKQLGDKLIVVVNNDNWLKVKKKYAFMSEQDRIEIISNFKSVDEVILTSHEENTKDMSVCNELKKIKPDIFANGGDRKEGNIPEYDVCKELNIEMAFNVGGEKLRSSSELVKKSKENKNE